VLLEKETTGLVVKSREPSQIPKPKWVAVGKAFTLRKLMISVLDRTMQRAWGLHGEAQFKDIGDNKFVVRFSSEGEWKHAVENGPWQFDFYPLLLQNYDGSVQPLDIFFNKMEV
jgi:hypothetical protein